jgi:hypothetical protein
MAPPIWEVGRAGGRSKLAQRKAGRRGTQSDPRHIHIRRVTDVSINDENLRGVRCVLRLPGARSLVESTAQFQA